MSLYFSCDTIISFVYMVGCIVSCLVHFYKCDNIVYQKLSLVRL